MIGIDNVLTAVALIGFVILLAGIIVAATQGRNPRQGSLIAVLGG